MKQIPLLQGKALLIEMPEGTIKHNVMEDFIDESKYWLCYKSKDGKFESIPLPPGNWRIIGMLSEVTEEQASNIVEDNEIGICYRDYQNINFGFDTALASLDSAILAEGYAFNNPLGTYEENIKHGDASDFFNEWCTAQSRVLDRSRCLLLGRDVG